MDFDNLERMIIDNQKSINRLLSAIQTLKEQQDKGNKELKDSLDYLSDSKIKEILKESSEDICLYTIKEGEWYFNNKPTGIKAIGKDGKDGHDGKDGKDGKNGLPGKDGQDGKDGKDGKNGLPGKDGKNGLNGLPGKDGKNGKDVDLRIGKVETVDDKASAKLRKENDIQYLDLKLPRGPQGFMGFDGINGKDGLPGRDGVDGKDGSPGKDGKDGTINGYNEIIIEAGENISLEQQNNKLVINGKGGNELTGGDNTVIEDNAINVYTNTGYNVIDKDIKIQSITDSRTTGTNKIVYAEDKEVMFIIDGTNKLRKSENGIDFEIIDLPRNCKDMLYMNDFNRLMGLSDDGYFLYSDDLGLNWTEIKSINANNINYLVRPHDFNKSFGVVNIANKTIISLQENFTQNTRIISTIAPNFWAKANDSQFIWCNNTGTFKYGAGSKEGDFPSLSGITVNLLKRVNNITILGLKNDNKIYLLEPATSITDYKWIEHSLKDTCTVNDIIYNPYDETYYIFTDINTYYKTKDFVNYESINKDNLRGIQGYFTSEGIQMTTSNHNEILLAPTRTKLENKAQEWDRLLNKELWVGDGLELTEEGKVNVKTTGGNLSVSSNGVYLREVDENHLTLDILEGIYAAKAELWLDFDPYTMDMWYWESAVPYDTLYKASKIVFNQAGSFYDQITYETEIFVEQYEYGYLLCNQNMTVFKYVKLGNLSWFFNKGE